MSESAKIVEFQKLVEKTGILAFDTETTGLSNDCQVIGVSLATGDFNSPDNPTAFYLDVRDYNLETITEIIKPLFELDITFVGHNIKFDLIQLAKLGITPKGKIFDTLLAYWFVNPGSKKLGLKSLVKEKFNMEMTTYSQMLQKYSKTVIEEINGKTRKHKVKAKNLLEVDKQAVAEYGTADAFFTFKLFQDIKPQIDAMPSKDLFYEVDLALIPVLMAMECAGMKLDTARLKGLETTIGAKLRELYTLIIREAGKELNLDSPKQLAELLFTQRGLIPFKAGKSGVPSTDEEVLTRYANDGDGMCKLLLEYRQLTKLYGTYIKSLPLQVDKLGRLHPSFNIEGTATGRLSCDSPNLQNIPKEGELGKEIRKCFVAEAGNVLVKADYSQMELRMLAHVSNDPYLIYALRSGEDLHTKTAKVIFNKEDISEDERTKAKTVNFGTIYGMSPHGLAKSIDVTLEEARLYLNQYFRMYPLVREFKWETISYVRDKFQVKNIFGRTRTLKLSDGNLDRIALNTPIQGSCADIVKIAMIRLHDSLKGKEAKIVLQVHDEIIVECNELIAEEIMKIVKANLESINIILTPVKVLSKCPFTVEIEKLHSWKE